jgi:hypothetical protein
MALGVAEAERNAGDAVRNIDRTVEGVRANPDMTDARKQYVIAEFQELRQLFLGVETAFDLDPRDLDLVREREATLREMYDVQ